VVITAGKDKGQSGTVARVLRDQNRVIVEGYNLARAPGRARLCLPAEALLTRLECAPVWALSWASR
jgi:ribosomal protein L24